MRRKSGAILSNGSVDMLTSAVKSAGMEDVLDHLISVDPIRRFKTSPESYELVQEAIPVSKDEVLFVSSNAWDALVQNRLRLMLVRARHGDLLRELHGRGVISPGESPRISSKVRGPEKYCFLRCTGHRAFAWLWLRLGL
jgi:hypothetical protein